MGSLRIINGLNPINQGKGLNAAKINQSDNRILPSKKGGVYRDTPF
ncbi:hypothetical protein Oscil6304_4948 [Oscillatoria acuminata PCC 6304]|uniref:Uncharacterized protein n=1 Tax=Oscillatoria acuminata PCC 6304 TaxID=56110 RepID=K9TNM8_9CYAN|nr:hypothetical protein Oscil6304_4948 [Oscillatoria acuminata PCC 6304]